MSIASKSSILLVTALATASLPLPANALPLFAPRDTLPLPEKSASYFLPFATVPVALFDQYVQGTVDFAAQIAASLHDAQR